MYSTFEEIKKGCKTKGTTNISVAMAADAEILKALSKTDELGITHAVLVGDEKKIKELIKKENITGDFEFVDASTEEESVFKAVELVRMGKSEVLMKGLVNTSIFMKGVLNKESGLRNNSLISHMACYEIPSHDKLLFCTDSGINVAPDYKQKKDILKNALNALNGMGYQEPKIALLAANEMVNEKIQSTWDASLLMKDYNDGEFSSCVMEGPIAFDVAFDKSAALHKGIESKVSGQVDLILSPSIEVGNALGKSWLHFNKAKWAGLVLGAKNPIILGSRSDTCEIKINAIALACLVSKLDK